jgi:3-deoxy-D-manno-octulosonic-acid transferase
MVIREFFYEIVLLLLALVAIPKMLYHRIFYGKYKKSLFKRFGFGFPAIAKGQRKLIWIHAVSVGETKAVATLAKMFKRQYDNPIVMISSTTETGHDEALRCIPIADYHVYLPLDFRWIIRPIVHRIKPDLVIMVETDFWYNFLKSSKDSGAVVAVVNGKISTSSLKRFQSLQKLSETLFSQVDLYCVQNELYKERFEQIGIPTKKIVITGNMKFDEVYPQLSEEEMGNWKQQLGIAPGDLVLVAGSTHHPEETLILDSLHEVWKQYPRLKLLLVPRHPERFNEVAGILSSQKLAFTRLSEWNAKNDGGGSVVLIDAMGVLRKCYQLADIAIVGGSYTEKVGGHNIIEPCWYGVPVIFGPHMFTQTELVSLVKEYEAGEQVPPEALTTTLLDYLGNPEKRSLLGKGGLRLTGDAKGATQKTFDAINAKLNQSMSI